MRVMRNKYIPDLCGLTGGLCLLFTVLRCRELTRGGSQAVVFVAVSLLLLAGLAVLLLRLEKADAAHLKIMLLPIGLAMLARVMCLDYAGSDYRRFLFPWTLYFRASGGFRAISADLGDYNVPYLYFLALISYTRGQPLYLIKLFSILADVMLAWGGFRLVRAARGKKEGDLAPYAAFALLLLMPTAVLNGAYWAQCDAVYGALAIHAVASALEGRNYSSAAMLGVAFCFKLQAIFLVPLWGVLLMAKRVRFRELFAFPAAYFVTILPALLLGKPLTDIIGVYFKQAGEYVQWINLNSSSVYALLPTNVAFDEKRLPLFGIAAAFLLALALMGIGYWMRGRLEDRTVVSIAVVMAIGVPFLLPFMHERYFFLADALTTCVACVSWKRFPAAVLAVGASLYSYALFLFPCPGFAFTVFGLRFSSWIGALGMLTALLFSAAVLARDLRAQRALPPSGGADTPAGGETPA